MGTSPITPCYDVELLKTNTHVGLDPGESVEYTKHRVSLGGHPWPGCRLVSDTWCPYIYGQTKQRGGLNNVGQANPEDCYLMALFHCMVRHGTVHFWGVFHWVLYLVPGTFLVPPRPWFQAIRTVTKM